MSVYFVPASNIPINFRQHPLQHTWRYII